jgi:uncharacterized membrane protein
MEEAAEQTLKREHPAVWWVSLCLPVLGSAVILGVLGALRGNQFLLKVLALVVVIEAVVGRFVILGGAAADSPQIEMFLTRVELFWLVAWIDFCVATLFLFHAGFVFRLWRIGPWLERVRGSSREIVRRHPWVGRFSFLGVVVYVGLPFLGSGAILGAMLGQLSGLRRSSTLAAVMIGTLLGNSLMLLLAEALMRVPMFREANPWVILGAVLVVGGVVLGVNWKLADRLSRKPSGGAGPEGPATPPTGP